jgi:hypothetical protein
VKHAATEQRIINQYFKNVIGVLMGFGENESEFRNDENKNEIPLGLYGPEADG